MADESKTGILGHLPPLPRPALNNSVIGMEQAYRQRKGLPLLTDADIEALKAGQPMPWEEGGVAPAAASAASTPRLQRPSAPRDRRPRTSRPPRREASAKKLPSGSRKETSGASPPSPPSRRAVAAKVCRR